MESKECLICRGRADHTHHLICGTANRNLSDSLEDNLKVSLCAHCHNQLHNNADMVRLSKISGQSIFELKQMINYGCTAEQARQRFIGRYGKNFIW